MTESLRPDDSSPRGWAAARVELLVAVLVTAMMIAAVFWVVRSQARLQEADAELRLAYVACQNQLEALRKIPFARLQSIHGSGFDVPGSDGSPGALQPVLGDADGLPGRFTVTIDKADGDAVLYLVSASVAWQGSLRDQTFELETLMGERR